MRQERETGMGIAQKTAQAWKHGLLGLGTHKWNIPESPII